MDISRISLKHLRQFAAPFQFSKFCLFPFLNLDLLTLTSHLTHILLVPVTVPTICLYRSSYRCARVSPEVSLFRSFVISKVRYISKFCNSEVWLLWRFVILKVRFSEVSFFWRFIIAKFRYSEGSLFRRFVFPKFRYSEVSLLRRFVIPKFRYSEQVNPNTLNSYTRWFVNQSNEISFVIQKFGALFRRFVIPKVHFRRFIS